MTCGGTRVRASLQLKKECVNSQSILLGPDEKLPGRWGQQAGPEDLVAGEDGAFDAGAAVVPALGGGFVADRDHAAEAGAVAAGHRGFQGGPAGDVPVLAHLSDGVHHADGAAGEDHGATGGGGQLFAE